MTEGNYPNEAIAGTGTKARTCAHSVSMSIGLKDFYQKLGLR